MVEDQISDVEIDGEGRLRIRLAKQALPHIWRAAMEVYWDPATRTLYSPKPRERSYAMWFQQIVAAARDEYGLRLLLTPRTQWSSVPEAIRHEIESLPQPNLGGVARQRPL